LDFNRNNSSDFEFWFLLIKLTFLNHYLLKNEVLTAKTLEFNCFVVCCMYTIFNMYLGCTNIWNKPFLYLILILIFLIMQRRVWGNWEWTFGSHMVLSSLLLQFCDNFLLPLCTRRASAYLLSQVPYVKRNQ